MKKAYIKPEVFVESFALNQNIASTCGVPGGGNTLGKPNHSDKTTCGWDMGNFIAWVEAPACNMYLSTDGDTPFGVCYNTPSGGVTIFGS